MKEFTLIFRNTIDPLTTNSPQEMQAVMKLWQDWIGGIAAQDKLTSTGNQLTGEGATIKPGNIVTNGPFAEIKEMVGGYMIIKSETLEGAVELAKGCPILHVGGSVEVRGIVPMNH